MNPYQNPNLIPQKSCNDCEVHDKMSVSEREQTKCGHSERRMTIMNKVHDRIYTKAILKK